MILTAEVWELLVEVLELITDNSSVGVDGGSVELTADVLSRRWKCDIDCEILGVAGRSVGVDNR